MIGHIFFILRGRRTGGYWSDRDDERRETPMEILKRRYAKGGITREDFGRKRRDIGS
ncbi:MAG: SHOCT domain-containing protein [Deltaproteobacteria bacterium]|nr:SHOCT domain-containing protein [Deltaproteobacteria bacterium]